MRRSILAAGLATTIGLSLAPLPASAAAERQAAPKLPSVQIAAASDAPAAQQGEAFHRSDEFGVWRGGIATAFHSGFRDANGRFVVDDVLTIHVIGPAGQTRTQDIDFTQGCTTAAPVPKDYLNVNGYLFPGLNRVSFALSDKCGNDRGSSDVFLSGSGLIDPATVASTGCSLSGWIGGMTGSPAFQSSSTPPKVNSVHRIEGTGSVAVIARVNCSAQVTVMLETKVCNRFGGNCNARTIASSTPERLPASGLYSKTLTGACRSGTDSYRVRVRVMWTVNKGMITGLPIPKLETNVKYVPDGDKGWVKLAC